ncbi:2OG-Fe(II) oxygenase [Dermacoccus nishinomiyaensis]|uniref:2OG-Fe(II) oxygenase n=1 Tax=Dermacoccus nishinomiyaensis TaxID=1274 RepID=UPI001EF56260|nr:2OG-Fe(II) oxygenase [Dermacoccus nishinomiyaensis]MCG7430874.1 2OG-Fe(II) oxygenase [Dermacoccus nishinomiyaensis]
MQLDELFGFLPESRASDLAYVEFSNTYDVDQFNEIARSFQAHHLPPAGNSKFLSLTHLRGAHTQYPYIARVMRDKNRLASLSELAGVELEPYPMTQAGSHINMYGHGHPPITAHNDGPSFVEVIPMEITDDYAGGETVIHRSPPSEAFLGVDNHDPGITLVPKVGKSVLMQGRMLLHHVNPILSGSRVTLVLPLQSKREPWKDGNTLFRLLLDDPYEMVVDEWCAEQVRRANLYKMAHNL